MTEDTLVPSHAAFVLQTFSIHHSPSGFFFFFEGENSDSACGGEEAFSCLQRRCQTLLEVPSNISLARSPSAALKGLQPAQMSWKPRAAQVAPGAKAEATKPAPGGVFDLGGLEEHVRTATWTCFEETWTWPKASLCCRRHKSTRDTERGRRSRPALSGGKGGGQDLGNGRT